MSEQWLDVVADATDVLTHDGSHISYNNDVLHLLVGPGKDHTFTSGFLKSIGRPDVFSKDLVWCDSVDIHILWDDGDIINVINDCGDDYCTLSNIKYLLAMGDMSNPQFCHVDDCLLIRNTGDGRVAILKGVIYDY